MNILLTERINDSNQYIELLARAYQDAGHRVLFDVQNFLYSDFLPDVVHIHWPEAIYRWRHQLPENEESLKLIESRLDRYKENGVIIVYTAHNLLPHKNVTDFDREVYKTVIASAHLILHHGHASIDILKSEVPECSDARHAVCPHGPYDFEEANRDKARKKYGLPNNKQVILNFGRQRKSKGPEFIRDVFHNLSSKDAFLFSIGPNPPVSKTAKAVQIIRQKLQKTFPEWYRGVDYFRTVAHEEIPAILSASDILFLGHQSGLNSGLIALAVSYGKPVVYPDLGNFKEQAAGWYGSADYTPGDSQSAVNALRKMLRRLDKADPKLLFSNATWIEKNSWGKSVSIALQEVEKLRTLHSEQAIRHKE